MRTTTTATACIGFPLVAAIIALFVGGVFAAPFLIAVSAMAVGYGVEFVPMAYLWAFAVGAAAFAFAIAYQGEVQAVARRAGAWARSDKAAKRAANLKGFALLALSLWAFAMAAHSATLADAAQGLSIAQSLALHGL